MSHDPCHIFQVKISKDEECLLLDNSEITKWKVCTNMKYIYNFVAAVLKLE